MPVCVYISHGLKGKKYGVVFLQACSTNDFLLKYPEMDNIILAEQYSM